MSSDPHFSTSFRSAWQRLCAALGGAANHPDSGEVYSPVEQGEPDPEGGVQLHVDAALAQSLGELAEREGLSIDAAAANLIHFALEYRLVAERNLALWDGLTRREQEVTALVCQNHTYQEIAEHLVISVDTVKSHVSRALKKFGVDSRRELQLALAYWDFRQWLEGRGLLGPTRDLDRAP